MIVVGLLFHGGYRLSRKISRRKNLNYAKAFSKNAKAFSENAKAFSENAKAVSKNAKAFFGGPTLHSNPSAFWLIEIVKIRFLTFLYSRIHY